MENSKKRASSWLLLVVAIATILVSCKLGTKQADLEEFVDTGLSMVDMRSCTLVPSDGSVLRLPSGLPLINATVVVVNPKDFAITYSLSYDLAALDFISLPTTPAATDTTHATFNFAFQPTAEHKTLSFTLGKYVASINKTYEDETFSVICDSPPNAATGLATGETADFRACLGFVAPQATSDDDLAKVEISWRKSTASTPTVTTLDYNSSSLTTPPSPNPLGGAGAFNRYFQSSGIEPGYAYDFSVVLIDAAGQRSLARVAPTSAAHGFTLRYDSNYAGGEQPLLFTQQVGDQIAVAGGGTFSRPGYALASWTANPDGSGASRAPGSSFAMPASDVALYAQWNNNGIVVSFDIGNQALSFSPSSVSVARGSTLSLSCANSALASGGSNWQWYLDGNPEPAQQGSSYAWTTGASDVGQHIVSCLVTYKGITYSGSVKAAVTY